LEQSEQQMRGVAEMLLNIEVISKCVHVQFGAVGVTNAKAVSVMQ
jgi:hypothetical protein